MDKFHQDKNKISDTDSFWDQLDGKINGKTPTEEETPSPLAAEKADGSIAIDRNQLLRAVGQLTQNPLDETDFSYREEASIQQQRKSQKKP